MKMDLKESELMLKAAFDSSSILEQVAVVLRSSIPEDEHRALRLAIGRVLNQIGEDLIEPVFVTHPDLKPRDTNEAWAALRQRVGARAWKDWP
jgi:hypothetical protein